MKLTAATAATLALLASMPQFMSHKVVRAAKIVDITGAHSDRPAVVVEHDGEQKVIEVPTQLLHSKGFEVGGYLVVYEDGYVSYSPAQPFEDGYSRIDEDPSAVFEGGEPLPASMSGLVGVDPAAPGGDQTAVVTTQVGETEAGGTDPQAAGGAQASE